MNKRTHLLHLISVITTEVVLYFEADIIVEGSRLSEQTHGVRYLWFIGHGDSSVYYAVVTGIPYGHYVQKVECANHTIKCYQNHLMQKSFRISSGLFTVRMRRITHGGRCAIKMHSTTGDVAALRHDLQNGM